MHCWKCGMNNCKIYGEDSARIIARWYSALRRCWTLRTTRRHEVFSSLGPQGKFWLEGKCDRAALIVVLFLVLLECCSFRNSVQHPATALVQIQSGDWK